MLLTCQSQIALYNRMGCGTSKPGPLAPKTGRINARVKSKSKGKQPAVTVISVRRHNSTGSNNSSGEADSAGKVPLKKSSSPKRKHVRAPSEVSVDAGPNESTKIRAVVTRLKTGDSFGFGVGASATGAILVTDLVLGGPADGKLQVGDQFDRLNGTEVGSDLPFHEFLNLAGKSCTLMLECTRLSTLDHPEPLPTREISPSALRPPTPKYAGGGLKETVVPRQPTINVSISDLLPHVKITQRRTSFGRRGTSVRPKIGPIQEVIEEDVEEDADDMECDPKANAVWVTLKRQPSSPFGFSTAMVADKQVNGQVDTKVVISRVASNIANWGMLQVGDQLLSVDDSDITELTHSAINRAIASKEVLRLLVLRPKKQTDLRPLQTTMSRRGSVSMLFHSAQKNDESCTKATSSKTPAPPMRLGNDDLSETWPVRGESPSLDSALKAVSPKGPMMPKAVAPSLPDVPKAPAEQLKRAKTSIGFPPLPPKLGDGGILGLAGSNAPPPPAPKRFQSVPNLSIQQNPYISNRSDGGSAFSKALAGLVVKSSLQH